MLHPLFNTNEDRRIWQKVKGEMTCVMKTIQKAAGVLLLCLLMTTSAGAATIYVSVAASMTDVFKEIITVFSKEHPSVKVRANFGSSGTLAKQIAQGAPADLYISANPKWMNYLKKNSIITDAKSRVFAYNSLVFIGATSADITEITQLASLDKISIGSPQSVPAGEYAKQAMEHAAIYQTMKSNHKLVLAKDVRQALIYADRGEVDGAFVYRTDALLAKNATIRFSVPPSLYEQIACPIGLTERGGKNEDAVRFYGFMSGATVEGVLRKHGFKPALLQQLKQQ